ncbi:MAG: hypothetical protein U1A23_02860 [Candidatus Sungbacteria bacterium]|nr:hypothetical protein [bacterium]MDZ4285844.1 hypothetical protein [Candidatus Sungbacteria bacterium]
MKRVSLFVIALAAVSMFISIPAFAGEGGDYAPTDPSSITPILLAGAGGDYKPPESDKGGDDMKAPVKSATLITIADEGGEDNRTPVDSPQPAIV